MSTAEQHLQMTCTVVDFEVRRNWYPQLMNYQLPKSHGRGTFEVAGIKDSYHPDESKHRVELINDQEYGQLKSTS